MTIINPYRFASASSSHWSANGATLDAYDTYLKAVYKFNSGALTADSRGANALTNNGVSETASGKDGYGAVFTRADSDYMTIASVGADFKPTTRMCISFWVKFTTLPGPGETMALFELQTNGSYYNAFKLNKNMSSVLKFEIMIETTSYDNYWLQGSVTVAAATWYNFVYYADGDYLHIYQNGALFCSLDYTGTTLQETTSVLLGNDYAARYLNATFDEFCFWKDVNISDIGAFASALYNTDVGAFWNP
jgi:hypothetical protein